MTRAACSSRDASGRAVSSDARRRRRRYAVIGQGYISQVAELPAFAHARRNPERVGLGFRRPSQAKYAVPDLRVSRIDGYEDFDTLLASGEIDAVHLGFFRRSVCPKICITRGWSVVTCASARSLVRPASGPDRTEMPPSALHHLSLTPTVFSAASDIACPPRDPNSKHAESECRAGSRVGPLRHANLIRRYSIHY